MNNFEQYHRRFSALKCCVVIPTYNNARTLASVISDVLAYTTNVIVINDGSTDTTIEVLSEFNELQIISYPKNQGKGTALKHGFKKAEEMGFEYAISLDSDGQHFAEDLPAFLERLKQKRPEDPELLLIGSRKMNDPSVPKKSSFGNRFSNFWFWVETGIKLSDTQCGFRLYPLKTINEIKLYTSRFEFEIEVIVKAAWRKVEVENIPVKVHYEKENRVSHFRPFQDFTRISFLNTWLVFTAFFFVAPRNYFQKYKEKGWNRFWKEDVLKSDESPFQKAKAVALGVFVGISPLWGLQTVLVLLFARVFRLNKLIAFLFSNISIPPLIPFIIYGSYQLGALVMGKNINWALEIGKLHTGMDVLKGMWQYILGSFVLAAGLSFLFGILFYFLFSTFRQKRSLT